MSTTEEKEGSKLEAISDDGVKDDMGDLGQPNKHVKYNEHIWINYDLVDTEVYEKFMRMVLCWRKLPVPDDVVDIHYNFRKSAASPVCATFLRRRCA